MTSRIRQTLERGGKRRRLYIIIIRSTNFSSSTHVDFRCPAKIWNTTCTQVVHVRVRWDRPSHAVQQNYTHTIAILSILTSIIYFYIQPNPIFPLSQRKIIKFHSQHTLLHLRYPLSERSAISPTGCITMMEVKILHLKVKICTGWWCMVLVIHRRRTIATIVDRKLTWNTILSSSGALAKAIKQRAPSQNVSRLPTPVGNVSSHVWCPTTTGNN